MKRFLPLLFLAACGHVDPRGLYAASQIDPLRDDPAGFAVAIAVSDELRLNPEGARLGLSVEMDGETVQRDSFALQSAVETGPAPEALVFTLAAADAALLRQAQAAGAASTSTAGHGAISLSVSFNACVNDGQMAEDAIGSVWLRTKSDARFAPLVKEAPMSEIPEWKTLIRDFETCPD